MSAAGASASHAASKLCAPLAALASIATAASAKRIMTAARLWSAGIEALSQSLPATVVIGLQLRTFECKARGMNHRARLEHERHGIGNPLRLAGVGRDGLLERLRVR